MKTYDQLTPTQQHNAFTRVLTDLLTDITNGAIRFNDSQNGNDLQARIDAAGVEAERLQTPWFWAEIIMEKCHEELEGMARATAKDSLYSEPSENIIAGIAA